MHMTGTRRISTLVRRRRSAALSMVSIEVFCSNESEVRSPSWFWSMLGACFSSTHLPSGCGSSNLDPIMV